MYTAVRHAIVFARFSVRNTKRTHRILTQVFGGVARCLQANASTLILVCDRPLCFPMWNQ